MSKFYLPSSTPASTASPSPLQSPRYDHEPRYGLSEGALSEVDEDEDTLPFPAPLPRSAFLAPDFSPQEYLSSLRNRHQTLEDLRSDLRSRVQDLSKELSDLVNNEYEDFLSMGSTLQGGEDKIEQVKLGVLGFSREVEGVRDSFVKRSAQMTALLEHRKAVRRDIALGRRLLDMDERLEDLEMKLGVVTDREASDNELDEDAEDGEEVARSNTIARLHRYAMSYLQLAQSFEAIGDHPHLAAQRSRLSKVKTTLVLDMNNTLGQVKTAGSEGKTDLLNLVSIYRQLDQGHEAIRILKS